MQNLTRRTLSNGVRFVHEYRADSTSMAIHAMIAAGSRHEREEDCGLTHFVEHMLFKGTDARDVFEIARIGNLFGGAMNASTSHDSLRVTTRVILDDLRPALEFVRELLLESTFPEEEVERERGVIQEEIAEYQDSPEDLCFDNFLRQLWHPHPLGRPILGTEATVGAFSRESLVEGWRRILSPNRLVLSFAGGMPVEDLLPIVEEIFGRFGSDCPDTMDWTPAVGQGGCLRVERALEQVQFCMGLEAITRRDPRRYALILMDVILGGGMGSRLFNEIREKRGLAYTIGSSFVPGLTEGYAMMYGSTTSDHIDVVLELCQEEALKLATEPPSAEELETARRMVVRSLLLSRENNGFLAGRNADRELYGDEWLDDSRIIERLQGVMPEQVRDVARDVFGGREMTLSLVGPAAAESAAGDAV